MKKILLPLFLGSLLLGGLSACQKEKQEALPLTYGKLFDEGASKTDLLAHVLSLSYSDFRAKLESEECFALLVYEKDNSCLCWATFQESVLSHMKRRDFLLYAIERKEFDGGREIYGLDIVSGEATIALFGQGALHSQKRTHGIDDPFITAEGFASWFDEAASPSSMLYVTKEQLDSFKETKTDPYLVYFARGSCSDCAYINTHFLFDWNKAKRKESYVLECDAVGIRYESEESLEKGEISQSLWQGFKDDYGLSEAYNEELGYGEGYVPTFAVYNPGSTDRLADTLYDMAVPFNDALTENDGAYSISDSFYTPERMGKSPYFESRIFEALLGKKIAKEDVLVTNGVPSWKKEKALEAHKGLLEGFLENYLSL